MEILREGQITLVKGALIRVGKPTECKCLRCGYPVEDVEYIRYGGMHSMCWELEDKENRKLRKQMKQTKR